MNPAMRIRAGLRWVRASLVASCVVLSATSPVLAKPAESAPAKTAPAAKARTTKSATPQVDPKVQAQLEQAKVLLAASQREQVEAGIQALGLLGVEAAVEPLVARVRQGLPPELLETAIVTLMALGQPSAGPVLEELSRHRRAEVRTRALEALAAVRPPNAEPSLVRALADSDAGVRAAAAQGLGEIGSNAAIDTLFIALDHGNLDAATAIGKLVPARDVKRLLDYLGKVPFRSLAPAFSEALKRKDVTEGDKLAMIARLEELGTGEIKGFFADVMATSEGGLPPNISRAILRAMQEIADR